jgi:hypothetical protein
LAKAPVGELQLKCRRAAEAATTRAQSYQLGSIERMVAQLEALLWYLLAGAVVGLMAGYASHLILDAGTTRGLPLVGL